MLEAVALIRLRRGVVLLTVAAWCAVVTADSWPMPRPQVYTSAHGTRIFRTRPPQHSVWSGKSQGTLFTRTPGGSESVVWSRELVNIPVQAFVTDDGKYVVTLDTWAKLGREHSVVVYGDEGRIVADRGLEDLLSAEEIANVRQAVGSRDWLMDASIAFNDREDQ